jgi:hypothetical protein
MKKMILLSAAFLLAVIPAFAQHSVGLAWGAPTGTPAAVSYNAYRLTGTCPAAPATVAAALTAGYTKINTAAITLTAYTDSSATLAPSTTYCYFVTAVSSSGAESVPSNQAPATIPAGAPSAPTGLTISSVN